MRGPECPRDCEKLHPVDSGGTMEEQRKAPGLCVDPRPCHGVQARTNAPPRRLEEATRGRV